MMHAHLMKHGEEIRPSAVMTQETLRGTSPEKIGFLLMRNVPHSGHYKYDHNEGDHYYYEWVSK